MSIEVQRRYGTTAEHSTFTGALAELTVDTDKKVVVTHDGLTPGGFPMAKENHTHAIIKSIAFYIDDVLEVDTNLISIIVPEDMTITNIILAVDTAPTGANLIIDINKNGTTIYTTQANRPAIAIDGTTATATLPDVVSLAVGDKISLDIDQIGSTSAGENLSVTIICEVV